MADCTTQSPNLTGLYCPAVHDKLLFWPPTTVNQTVYQLCPKELGLTSLDHRAYRTCLADGTWRGNWTNYTACMNAVTPEGPSTINDLPQTDEDFIHLAVVLKDLYLATSLVSLVFLLTTLFIFCYFRSLQCSRISIHKNLVISFIMHFVLIILMVQPYTIDIGVSYRETDWLCKTIISLSKYAQTANFAWMLVEGIYLHNRLAVCVFTSVAPFKLFCFIGWGLPLMITCLWSGLMSEFHPQPCWKNYAKSPFIFIIFIPIVIALVVNSAFLVNIIRVLVVKLRTNNTLESRRIRKAIKATVVLLPLLGVTNLLFLAQPTKQGTVMAAYRVINTILPSCQGIFVSVLYCFMNSEVQNVIRKKWKRFRVNRAMYKGSRRQGSRTSSYCLSQSDVTTPRRLNVFSKSLGFRDKDYNSISLASSPALRPCNGRNGMHSMEMDTGREDDEDLPEDLTTSRMEREDMV